MKIVAIIQARMGSSRLPNKVLLKINNKTVLEYLIGRLRKSKFISSIIIATSILKENDAIEDMCNKNKIKCFRGSENNVLERYYKCATEENADHIVRITGDCPLIDYNIVDYVISEHLKNNNDYTATNVEEGKHFPRGQDIEIFTLNILKKVFDEAKSDDEKEHVTLYITKNNKKFKIQMIDSENNTYLDGVRLCVDEIADFELIKNIINYFYPKIDFTLENIKDYLEKNKELKEINKDVVQKIHEAV